MPLGTTEVTERITEGADKYSVYIDQADKVAKSCRCNCLDQLELEMCGVKRDALWYFPPKIERNNRHITKACILQAPNDDCSFIGDKAETMPEAAASWRIELRSLSIYQRIC